jgi:hypothetical protein
MRQYAYFANRRIDPLTPTLSPEYRGEGEYASISGRSQIHAFDPHPGPLPGRERE